ncbi:zinc carboxypeptidase A 1-like [Musca vetustissima]|uniref:zinc carboxypeptidase A 1-like n=1 Tax=Musca vetustissima TaxID=27455 RepID=UPI002AB7E5BF|nr:zinc carboxypeptidase A 1-like [Musca vetustissima]
MANKLNLVLGFCLLTVALSSGERARYDNYRVYKTTASSPAELEVLKNLEGASDSIMFLDGIHNINKPINVVVAPHKVPDFLEIMGANEIEYELVETNLQSQLEDDEEQVARPNPRARSIDYNWNQYYQLEDTYKWMQQLTVQYPGVVTLIEGGKTYQGRSILGVKISKSKTTKPGIFVEAGIHAREWIAPATATYMINQLLTSNVESIRNIAENYDWYIFPHANPDGYVYTHTTDRMWRKTRAPYGSCFGADPNRNWGFQWNVVGSSNNPCSDTYAGPSAFSEIETRSLSEYIASLKGKIFLYISFHAYSQYLLYPYGHTASLPANGKDLKQVFDVSVAAMNKRYGTKYTGGNIYDAIYPASGASVDWAYENVGTKMAFCYELRPSSNSVLTGFKLPASQIIPTGEETMDSVTAMVQEVQKLGYFKN